MQLPPFPKKTDPLECSIITSGGHLPAKVLPAFQDCNMDTLPEELSTATTVSAYPCLKINSEHIKFVMIWPTCAESVHHLIRQTVNRHYLVYPQHRQLTQVQLLRRNISLLEFTTTTSLQTVSITLTRTFCPEQLFKRQSERL